MRAWGNRSFTRSVRARSTSATATSSKPGCFEKLVMSAKAIPPAPMLACRTFAASAAKSRDEPIQGATAAPAATVLRKSRRVWDMAILVRINGPGLRAVLQGPGDQPLAVEHLGAVLGAHRVAYFPAVHLTSPATIALVFSVQRHRCEFSPRVQRVERDVEVRVSVPLSQPFLHGICPNAPQRLESRILRVHPLPHQLDDQKGGEAEEIGLPAPSRSRRAHAAVHVEPGSENGRVPDAPGDLPGQAARGRDAADVPARVDPVAIDRAPHMTRCGNAFGDQLTQDP